VQDVLTQEEFDCLECIGRRRGLMHGLLTIEAPFKDGEIQCAKVGHEDRVFPQGKRAKSKTV
jgi:hypothetical protein